VGAAIAACALSATACGSPTLDLARAEFSKDGGFRGAARVASMSEPAAKTLYGARYHALCADVGSSALPVDGTWHEDGPRIVVETSGTFGTRVVLYHRVSDGTLTLASDGGFRDGVQSYVRAK